MKSLPFLPLAIILLAACASKTDVHSEPRGAQSWCEHDWQEHARENCP